MKKGFTLIELLAVIIIMAIIFLVVVPSVDRTIKNNKIKMQNVQYKKIEKGLDSLLAENVFALSDDDYTMYISYIQLVESGYAEYKNNDPVNKNNYYNPYTILEVINLDGKREYVIPTYAASSVTKQQLDALQYCTISSNISKNYEKALIKCNGSTNNIEPVAQIKGANTVYTYNVGTNMNLYQNIME